MDAEDDPTALCVKRAVEAEAPHAAGLKRKKTVTWADGEDVPVDSEGEELEADDDARGAAAQEGPGPGVVVVPLAADPLFAGMDEAALQQQVEVAKSEGEALDRPRLLRRRLQQADDLIGTYEAEVWALADELLLRRLALRTAQPEVPLFKGGGAAPALPPHPALAAALSTGGVRAAWEATRRRRHGRGVPAAPPPLPSCDELEDLVLSLPLPGAEESEALRQRLVQRREDFVRRLDVVGRLETAAQAAACRELDAHGAVAALCGRRCRYLIRRTAVVLGRATRQGAGAVDVDLAREDPEAVGKVSRQQAHIFLDADGSFKLRCLGRRAMSANGRALRRGQLAALPHLSMVRVGQVALLWVVNSVALERLLRLGQSVSV